MIKKLERINTNKAPGPNGLTSTVLKTCAASLGTPLASIFNRCIAESKLASSWSDVKITPVPKKQPGKFRPIASTSQLLKVFECIVLDRLRATCKYNDLHQFAYKKRRSTVDAVAFLLHQVTKLLDSKALAIQVCFLDYSNAFNCVDRPRLLSILCEYGVPPILLHWIKSYFTDRYQFTTLNGRNSTRIPITTGVLQGAILSPFFFSTYISKLPEIPGTFTSKFADDVAIGSALRGPSDHSSLQCCLSSLQEWSQNHALILNPNKCSEMTFSLLNGNRRANLTSLFPCPVLNDQPIQHETSFKYLGITLSENLSWHAHLMSVSVKTRRLSFYALKLKCLSVRAILIRRFVFCCILPHLLYCSPVIFSGLLVKDFVIIRRCLKVISKLSGIAYKDLSDFIIAKHFAACDRLCDVILSDPDHPLHSVLNSCQSIRSTRSNFKLPHTRTTKYRNSFIPYLIRLLTRRKLVISELVSHLSLNNH